MNAKWLDESEMYLCSRKGDDPNKPPICDFRQLYHCDLPSVAKLVRMKTYDMFGDIEPAKIYEMSYIAVGQVNEARELVSCLCLSNYPNVPSVPPYDWLNWIHALYGVQGVEERNTLFVHLLVWDTRYNKDFFKPLLDGVFSSTSYCAQIVMVMPPWVTPVDVIEEQMTRIAPRDQSDSYRVQALYISFRHRHTPKLKIRRVVEEDNDDVIPIVEAETTLVRETYGDYYISEMMRYPDGRHQLVVSESDGLATGVMCLNDKINVDVLNENFELGSFNGLRKPHEKDVVVPADGGRNTSETFFSKCPEKRQWERSFDDWRRSENGKIATTRKTIVERAAVPAEPESPGGACNCDDEQSDRNDAPESCPVCFPTDRSRESSARKSAVSFEPETRSSTVASARTESKKLPPADGRFETPSRKSVTVREPPSGAASDSRRAMLGAPSADITEKRVLIDPVTIVKRIRPGATEDVEMLPLELVTISSPTKTDDSSTNVISKPSDSTELLFNANSGNVAAKTPYQSKLRLSIFAETISDVPKRSILVDADKVDENLVKADDKPTIPSSRYHGKPNAFCLELFSMQSTTDERKARDYLEAAFECFPDLDYCVLMMPSTCPFFPFLHHFVQVPLRFDKDFPMVMYLTHRASFLAKFASRQAVRYDRELLEGFLEGVPYAEAVLASFDEAVGLNDRSMEAVIFFCDDNVAGLAITRVETEVDFFRCRYHIEDHVSLDDLPLDGHCRILHLVVMPIFEVYHRYFFRELTRISGATVLYYRLEQSDVSASTRTRPLMSFLDAMLPMRPRRRIDHSYNRNDENLPKSYALRKLDDEEEERFSLFMTTPRYAMMPKIDVNAKIVIIGASDCGLAVAEYLALESALNNTRFTNITLVSPHGIPFEKKMDDLAYRMIPYAGRYCRSYANLLAIRTRVNVIYGSMTLIDRKDKYITVKGLGHLSYDYLVLTCGQQFQKPKFAEEIEAEKKGELKDYEVPSNCLMINDDTEATECLEFLKRLTKERDKTIVVYGRNIECYCALHGILRSGVKGSDVTLIEPPLPQCVARDEIFYNITEAGELSLESNPFRKVDMALTKAVRESGITVLSGWELAGWTLRERRSVKWISGLTIRSKSETREVRCDALVNFYEKTVPKKTFIAISRAGLVFDGLLVIDPEFRTNDPFVFAAGTMTKYSRKFHAENWSHKYYSRVEVGEKLAKKLKTLIELVDLNEESEEALSSKLSMTLPVFRAPIVSYINFPGGYHFLAVRKNGKPQNINVAILQDTYGEVLITGRYDDDIGYFRLRMNKFKTVETITCLSKKNFEVENIITLYGKHDALLNDVMMRFKRSLISDLYAYFREPWATALFYDKFECLRVENRAALLSKTTVNGNSLVDDCLQALIKSKWEPISNKDREYIEARYAGSVYQEEIENNLVDFLLHSEDCLPMYCNHRKVRSIVNSVEHSSLFNSL